uniref:Glutathione peroxidase 4 n=1 Tax=Hippocampus comes TaxID=109280 RepID=A0A3Q2X9W4_HIPCM
AGWAASVLIKMCSNMRPLCLMITCAATATIGVSLGAPTEDWSSATSIYDFSATDIDGNVVSLEKYRGNVVIITNVASK